MYVRFGGSGVNVSLRIEEGRIYIHTYRERERIIRLCYVRNN